MREWRLAKRRALRSRRRTMRSAKQKRPVPVCSATPRAGEAPVEYASHAVRYVQAAADSVARSAERKKLSARMRCYAFF